MGKFYDQMPITCSTKWWGLCFTFVHSAISGISEGKGIEEGTSHKFSILIAAKKISVVSI